MNDRFRDDQERAHALMMAALDGELGADDRVELEQILAANDALRHEWEQMQTVKDATATMTYREPPEEVWDHYWVSVYNQMERRIGWLFLSVGLLIIFGWVAWQWVDALLADTELPRLVKGGIFAAVFGGGILFVSVVREKWFTRKRDPYKEVQR